MSRAGRFAGTLTLVLGVVLAQEGRAQEQALPPVGAAREPELSAQAGAADWGRVVGWPEGLAMPALEPTPIAAVPVERHRFADGVVELRARGAGDGRAIFGRFVDAVRRAGGSVEDEWVGASSASATLCASDCAHGRYFAMIAWDSWVRVTLRRAAARPPAPPASVACEPVPDPHFSICYSVGEARTQCSLPFATRFDVDVDRDGRADALVPVPAANAPERSCPRDVEWDVYLMRSDCGHRLGRLRGVVDPWSGAGARTSGGFLVVRTWIESADLMDEPISVENAVRRGEYRAVAETRHEARCDYHPADCEDGIRRLVCAVRGHPTIVAPFEPNAAGAALYTATQEAQRQCAGGIRETAPVRCDIDVVIAPDGSTSRVRVSSCGRATQCVRGVFSGLAFAPFTGEPQSTGISFQIPAP